MAPFLLYPTTSPTTSPSYRTQRLLLAGRLVLTCSRLKKAGLELPCIKIVEEDNQWMVKFAKDLGINASPKSARLAQIGEMIEYLDRVRNSTWPLNTFAHDSFWFPEILAKLI